MSLTNDLFAQLNQLIRASLQNQQWAYAQFLTTLTSNGSSKPSIFVFEENGNSKRFIPDEIFAINKLATSSFLELRNDPTKRFNKITFTVYPDGRYESTFVWDEQLVKQQELESAQVFPNWIDEGIKSLIYETGYAGERYWQQFTAVFTIHDNDLTFLGEIYYNAEPTKIDITLPPYLKKGILDHYQITNLGLLKSDWQPWNQLAIKHGEADFDPKKDVTYRLVL